MYFYVTTLEAATVCQDPLSGASGDAATHECLGCICEASSKFCNTKMGCVAGGTLCGPFLLSRGFWVDGGRCTEGAASGKYLINSQLTLFWCDIFRHYLKSASKLIYNFFEIDWKSCALDVKCAAKTLRSYYNAFAQVSRVE